MDESTAIFLLRIFSGIIISCFVAALYHMDYLKIKKYFKVSFKEYILLDTHTQNVFKDSANHKLHMEILARTEKES